MTSILDLCAWPKGHMCIFGHTRTGKSVLSDEMTKATSKHMGSKARMLIIDSKKRYHAEWEMTGIRATRRYRNLRGDGILPGSMVLPDLCDAATLRHAWDMAPGNIIIAQTDDVDLYAWLNEMILAHYHQAVKKYENLIYVDELLALTSQKSNAKGVKMVSICGGERGVWLTACTQRPRNIPIECMSEMQNAAVFYMQNGDDIDRLEDMGFPKWELDRNGLPILDEAGKPKKVENPPFDHSFWHWDGRHRILSRKRVAIT